MTGILRSRASIPLGLVLWGAGCGSGGGAAAELSQPVGTPSPTQVPLDPATIPQFVNQLTIPPVYAPKEIRDRSRVIRREYTVSIAPATVQMLPPGSRPPP